MFERPVALVALAVLLATVQASAQAPADPRIAAQRARIDSILPVYSALSREMYYADSLREAERRLQREALDTLVLHPFMVVARRRQSAEVFAMMRPVIVPWQSRIDGMSEQQRVTLLVEWRNTWPAALRDLAKRPRHRLVALYGDGRRERAEFAEAAVVDALIEFLPPVIRMWMLDQHLSAGRDHARIIRTLATSRSDYAVDCFRGNLAACARGLELRGVTDSLRGYSKPQIIALASEYGSYVQAGFRRECAMTGDLSACMRVFEPNGGLPAPIGAAARARLVLHTIETGGPGVIARLSNATAPTAEEALSQAAGRTADALIAGWRASLDQEQSETRANVIPTGLAALIWGSLALVGALRSTRRRFA